MKRRYYPAFLDLKGKPCVVVGGGRVAERKVAALLRAGARVRVISPAVTNRIAAQAAHGRLEVVLREYRAGDVKGAFLAIAATSDDRINAAVSADAPCLVNVVDEPERANFIVPSVVERGPLCIAVSTSGASPAMARAIRQELERLYGSDFGRYLAFMAALRRRALQEIPDKKRRERMLKAAASAEVLSLLRTKGAHHVRERALKHFDAARGRKRKGTAA